MDDDYYLNVIPYVKALEAYSRTTYQSIYVVDYYKMNFLYMSENILFLCGYSPEEIRSMGFGFYLL